MPCWPRLESIIILETILNWEQHAESTSECAHSPSQTLATLISSNPCQLLIKLKYKYFFIPLGVHKLTLIGIKKKIKGEN